MKWEQVLVTNVEGDGLVVILGCGHPSMERIILKAEAQYGLPVIGVVGGFTLWQCQRRRTKAS